MANDPIPTTAHDPGGLATIAIIRDFANYPTGWHYGQGGPADPKMIEIAVSVESLLRQLGYPNTGAFLGVDGEIKVTGYLNGKCISIEIYDEDA